MVKRQKKSFYSRVLLILLPALSFLLLLSYVLPQKLFDYVFGFAVIIVVIGFVFLLFKSIFTKLPPVTVEEQLSFEKNNLLPNTKYEAQPGLFRRIMFYISILPIIFVFTIDWRVGLLLSILFLPVALIFIFIVGAKLVSFVEFTSDGIYFSTRLYESVGIFGKIFVPYEKCYVGWLAGTTKIGYDESLTFFKGKMPYASISYQAWGEAWPSILEELKRRLPESRLPK
jgi:hypothetical protein